MKKIKKIKGITHIYTDQYHYFGVLYIYIYIYICRTAIVKEQYICVIVVVCRVVVDVNNKILKKRIRSMTFYFKTSLFLNHQHTNKTYYPKNTSNTQ